MELSILHLPVVVLPLIPSATSSDSMTASGEHISIGGLTFVPDFLTDAEEDDLMEMIDGAEWVLSQSGRRKQVVLYFFCICVVCNLL